MKMQQHAELDAAGRRAICMRDVGAGLPDCQRLREADPEDWKKGVPSAPLPKSKAAGEWVAFGDAQTGQLDIANGRFADASEIREQCEALLKKAGEAAQPKPWYQFW